MTVYQIILSYYKSVVNYYSIKTRKTTRDKKRRQVYKHLQELLTRTLNPFNKRSADLPGGFLTDIATFPIVWWMESLVSGDATGFCHCR